MRRRSDRPTRLQGRADLRRRAPRPALVPAGAAERILDTLRARMYATVFVQGRWARSQPTIARRIADDGHLVGHHSALPRSCALADRRGSGHRRGRGGRGDRRDHGCRSSAVVPMSFRAGHDDPEVLTTLASLGYRNVHWHVELEDWEPWRGVTTSPPTRSSWSSSTATAPCPSPHLARRHGRRRGADREGAQRRPCVVRDGRRARGAPVRRRPQPRGRRRRFEDRRGPAAPRRNRDRGSEDPHAGV